jgi:hypothetical protein
VVVAYPKRQIAHSLLCYEFNDSRVNLPVLLLWIRELEQHRILNIHVRCQEDKRKNDANANEISREKTYLSDPKQTEEE